MKPFKIIQGSSNNIGKFEDEVSQAIEDGYEFSSDLISKLIESPNKPPEILFFQAMTIEENLDFDDDELTYNEGEE